MSAHVPLWWLHPSVLLRLAAEVDAIVLAWARDWGVSASTAGSTRALTGEQLANALKLAEPLGNASMAGPWLKPPHKNVVVSPGRLCRSVLDEIGSQ